MRDGLSVFLRTSSVAYLHCLRARRPCEFEWAQVEFGRSAALHVRRRAKGGKASVHPIRGYELRMLTALRKAFPDNGYVFTTERRTPFTTDAINRLVQNTGSHAELPLPVHFHMLRHSCGYKLVNDGIDTGRSKIGSCRARDELWRHPNVQNETIAIFWRRNLDTVLIREHNRTSPEGDSLCVRLVKR
jgi:integrase